MHRAENDSELELIFVIMDSYTGGRVAIESNYDLVVFGTNIKDLTANIVLKVRYTFNGRFAGKVRLRKFSDTLMDISL